MFRTVQCKGTSALFCSECEYIVDILPGVCLLLYRKNQRSIQLIAEEPVCQHQRRDIIRKGSFTCSECCLLFLIERNAADVLSLVAVEQGYIAAVIQCADRGVVMTENFCFRGKFSLFAFIGMKQCFCLLIRNVAGNIGRKSIVVYHNELSIEHGLGIRYCLEDSQHLFIDAHPDALLYHQVLDKLAPGSINSSDADGTVVIQDLLSREKGVLPLDQPADISGYKAAEEQNSVLSCPLGDDFFGVPLKIFLCFHHDSSCIDKPYACIVVLTDGLKT